MTTQTALNLEQAIRENNLFKRALENKYLSLAYQPIVDIQNRRISGFEALMRWNDPDLGFVSPGIFIPIAEESGLIIEASKWALNEACIALKRIEHRTGFDRKMFMGVNFSTTDFASDGFVDNMYAILSKSDVAMKQIHLEVTQSLLKDQPENATEILKLCSSAGMGITLDDFGTGTSSLNDLEAFPIGAVKIDRNFVENLSQGSEHYDFVKKTIQQCHANNIKLIAEGVETLEETVTLNALGCDMAQGFYFAKPMPEFEATKAVKEFIFPKMTI